MPHLVTPNSFGTFVERNPCHNPKDGKFAPKGVGNCAPLTAIQNDLLGDRVHLPRAARERIANLAKDQNFDTHTALRMAGPAFRAQYLTLMEKAPGAHAEMTRNLDRVLTKVGGTNVPYAQITDPGGIRGSMGTIKGARRLIEKTVQDNFGDLTEARDVVRSSIAVDSPDQIEHVMRAVHNSFDVVRVKDRFKEPLSGYRDILVNVRMKNGLVGEIQIHAKPILKIKEGEGHRLYEKLRSASKKVSASMRAQVEGRMKEMYSSAWGAFVAATALSHVGRRFL